MTQALSTGEYLTGLLIFAVVLAAAVASGVLIVARRLPLLAGAARVVAIAVLAMAVLVVAHVAVGMLGILSRWSVLVASAVIFGLVALIARSRPASDAPATPDPRPRPSGRRSWMIAGLAALSVLAVELGSLIETSATPSTQNDTLTFHLPTVVRWIQDGSMWPVSQFVPVWSMGTYPNTAEVLTLAAVLPWRSDAFAGYVNYPMLALVAVSVYALALELGARRATATIFAAAVVSIPSAVAITDTTAMPDIAMLAMLTAGVLFLVRSLRTRRLADVVLGSIALGLGFGMKWNGVADAVAILAVFAVVWVGRRPHRIGPARVPVIASVVTLVTGGVWLLRNGVATGNPVIPVRVGTLGLAAPPDEIRHCVGYRIIDYLGDAHAWRAFIVPGYRHFLALPAVLILAGFVLATVFAVRRLRADHADERPQSVGQLAVVVIVLVLVAVYCVTPYSALGPRGIPAEAGVQSRYLFPALAVAGALGAAALSRLRGPSLVGAQVGALVAILLGLRGALERQGGFGIYVSYTRIAAIAFGLLAVCWAFAFVSRRLELRGLRVALVVAAAIGVVLAAAWGDVRQRRFNDRRYATGEPALSWIYAHASGGRRIALGGSWDTGGLTPILPAYGPRFRNSVQYVAPTEQTVLRDYATRSGWLSALRRGRYDLLIVGRGGYSSDCPIPGSTTSKDSWARAAGFPVLAQSSRLTLYRVRF